MSNIVDPGNFFGVGLPPRSLSLGNQQTRFPVEGDSWTDTTTSLLYIYREAVWNVMPQGDNLDKLNGVYQDKINAVVRVVAISNDSLDELTDFNQYFKFNSGGGFFVFDSTNGYIATSAQIILSPLAIPDSEPTPIEDNVFVMIFPEKVIARATVIGLERRMDIALLQVDLNSLSLGPRVFLNFIDNRNVSIGSTVMTIGHQEYSPIFPSTLINGVNTFRPNIQAIHTGIIADNKFTNDNMHVESIVINNYMAPIQGSPILDLNGNCVGMASWSLSLLASSYVIKGMVASNLINNVITFLKVNYRQTLLSYPTGYLGMVFKYYTSTNATSNKINLGFTFNKINGVIIQGTPNNPNAMVPVKARDGDTVMVPSINYEITPQLVGILVAGDIITAAAPRGGQLVSIGKMNNQFPLETIIMFNVSIDFEYRKYSEAYANAHLFSNLRIPRTGYENLFDFIYSELS